MPRAIEAVRQIDAIFAAGRAINGNPAPERLAVRQRDIAPLVAAREAWMRAERAKLSRHNDLAQAMDYMLKVSIRGAPPSFSGEASVICSYGRS